MNKTLMAGIAATILLAGGAIAAQPPVGQDFLIMSEEEMAQHRARMQELQGEEREAYRNEQYQALRERAREAGYVMPPTPVWQLRPDPRTPDMESVRAEHRKAAEAHRREMRERFDEFLAGQQPPAQAPRATAARENTPVAAPAPTFAPPQPPAATRMPAAAGQQPAPRSSETSPAPVSPPAMIEPPPQMTMPPPLSAPTRNSARAVEAPAVAPAPAETPAEASEPVAPANERRPWYQPPPRPRYQRPPPPPRRSPPPGYWYPSTTR